MEASFIIMMMNTQLTRRQILQVAGFGLALTCATGMTEPAFALKPGKPSKERLLRATREDKTEEELEEEKARLAEIRKLRLDRQKELQAAAERRKAGRDVNENEIEIESNLRGQYYFPTARKRYLPRVKRAWDSIPAIEEALRQRQWPIVSRLCEDDLTNAVLPMRLYASSLAGGGLSISAHFIDKMNFETGTYENALQKLVTAVKQKDLDSALRQLAAMHAAFRNYRQFGHLEAADFGIGEIPTDTRVGSGFGNNNSALYGKNKSFRDVITSNAVDRRTDAE